MEQIAEPGDATERTPLLGWLEVIGGYARHLGHADLVGVRIDGTTGG